MNKILILENLSVSDDGKSILSAQDLRLSDRGLTVIMGPMGAGKSTLLKFLSGNLDSRNFKINYETAKYNGMQLGKVRRPKVVSQKI